MGRTPSLGVSDPDFLKEAMVKQFSSLPNRSVLPAGGLFDYFLNSLKDEHWKHVRSALTPAFTSGKLKQVRNSAEEFCTKLFC